MKIYMLMNVIMIIFMIKRKMYNKFSHAKYSIIFEKLKQFDLHKTK